MIIPRCSLRPDKIANYSLAFILGIERPQDTKSIGDKSTSLSFNQKLNLLLDSQSMTKTGERKIGNIQINSCTILMLIRLKMYLSYWMVEKISCVSFIPILYQIEI